MQNLFLDAKTTQYGSHMVMTGSKTTPRTVYFNIDSRFRDDINSSTLVNYTFVLPEKISKVLSMQVISMEFPYTINNISDTNNNFYINDTKINIDSNYYNSIDTVVDSINTQISDLSFSIYYYLETNTSQYRCGFNNTSDANAAIYFNSKPTFNRIGGAGENIRNSLGWKLGFRKRQYTSYSGVTISGESYVDLIAPKYIYLVMEDFTNSLTNNSFFSPYYMGLNNRNIIAKIPIGSAIGTEKKYSFGDIINTNIINGSIISDKRTYENGVDLQKFVIQIVDEFGNIVNMNEMDFSLCLKFEL